VCQEGSGWNAERDGRGFYIVLMNKGINLQIMNWLRIEDLDFLANMVGCVAPYILRAMM
jgi:hypothetical protein